MASTNAPKATAATGDMSPEAAPKPAATAPRKIPGNLPYLNASGTLKKALDRLIEPAQPDKFNRDFLENVLKLKGGSAYATIPILKRLEFIVSLARVLGVNIAGIGIILNMRERMENMQSQMQDFVKYVQQEVMARAGEQMAKQGAIVPMRRPPVVIPPKRKS